MIGKCFYISFCIISDPQCRIRNYTNELVSGVPGQNMCGFKTEESAQVHYTANMHLGRVIRTAREDDVKFGPVEHAYDKNWWGYD
jgi:hypothetical protein